ncbi:MAG: hypothetical protein M3478_06135 [Planctomycetota bacterium]|nr:hypothetical protein [Planctomycetota bacterium]
MLSRIHTLNTIAFGLSTGKGQYRHNDHDDDVDDDNDRFSDGRRSGRHHEPQSLAASLEDEPDDLVIL